MESSPGEIRGTPRPDVLQAAPHDGNMKETVGLGSGLGRQQHTPAHHGLFNGRENFLTPFAALTIRFKISSIWVRGRFPYAQGVASPLAFVVVPVNSIKLHLYSP